MKAVFLAVLLITFRAEAEESDVLKYIDEATIHAAEIWVVKAGCGVSSGLELGVFLRKMSEFNFKKSGMSKEKIRKRVFDKGSDGFSKIFNTFKSYRGFAKRYDCADMPAIIAKLKTRQARALRRAKGALYWVYLKREKE